MPKVFLNSDFCSAEMLSWLVTVHTMFVPQQIQGMVRCVPCLRFPVCTAYTEEFLLTAAGVRRNCLVTISALVSLLSLVYALGYCKDMFVNVCSHFVKMGLCEAVFPLDVPSHIIRVNAKADCLLQTPCYVSVYRVIYI